MKSYFILLFIILFSEFSFAQKKEKPEVIISENAYLEADAKLNYLVVQIANEYRNDPQFVINLKATQKVWKQFRESELKMKFVDKPKTSYGNELPICKYKYLEKLTLDRIKFLETWMNGTYIGDICSGSVKINNDK